eukprot:snap_masked-scaffold_16-processed-gene-2.19-mRNA-1 protein AED:1.00 eAED:1.00 QI:0/0/0/0/1/1/3/0/66
MIRKIVLETHKKHLALKDKKNIYVTRSEKTTLFQFNLVCIVLSRTIAKNAHKQFVSPEFLGFISFT